MKEENIIPPFRSSRRGGEAGSIPLYAQMMMSDAWVSRATIHRAAPHHPLCCFLHLHIQKLSSRVVS